jgi:hypothetical protein
MAKKTEFPREGQVASLAFAASRAFTKRVADAQK